jgi:hypothetical protein
VRFGAKYQTAIEPLSFGMRFSTGSGLTSPHESFSAANAVCASGCTGASLFGDGLVIDRGYAKLKFLESGVLILGKHGYPLWQQTEQFWDPDISPEGYAAAYTASLGDAGSLTGAIAYYYLAQNSWSPSQFDNDTALAWQAAWKGSFQDLGLTIAGTGLHMDDGDSSGNYKWGGASGGLTDDPAFYMVSGQIKGTFNDVRWLIGGDYHVSDASLNAASKTALAAVPWTTDDHDSGFVIQARAHVNQWGIRYYYYDIEENSVPFYNATGAAGGKAELSQDNLPTSNGAPQGFEGHRIQFDYKFAKGVSSDFRIYIVDAKTDNYAGSGLAAFPADSAETRDINRYQLNFNVKF